MDNHRTYLISIPVYSVIAGLALFSFFEYISFRLGESGDVKEIVELQIGTNALFGQRYSNEKIDYKVEGAKRAEPDILILGTSRVLPIGGQSFPANKVYNAGMSASSSQGLEGMAHILESFAEGKYPSYVVMGLDPWIFNPNSLSIRDRHKATSKIKLMVKENIGVAWSLLKGIRFLRDELRSRANRYASLMHERNGWLAFLFAERAYQGLGLNAKLLNTGFRADGSFQYPAGFQENWKDPATKDHISSLKTDYIWFAASSSVDSCSIDKLNVLLYFARQKGISVIGLLPPYSPNYDRALKSMPSRSAFYREYQDKVCASFLERGFKCYNFTDISQFPELRGYGDSFDDSMHPKTGLVRGMMEIIRKENKQLN